MPAHSSASGTDLHESKRQKEPVRAASTANVTLASPGTTLDGVTLAVGNRLLLKNQAAPAENGIYTWSASASALVRTQDADSAADFVHGFIVYVREGTTNGATTWVYTTATTPPVLGSTSLTFNSLTSTGGGTVTSVAQTVPPEFSLSGSPVTTNGTLAITKVNQSANTFWAGPSSGSATAPAFRTIVPADMPVFGASGPGHTSGAVPDPGASVGSGRFLREDQTWSVPQGVATSGSGGGGGGGGSGALVPIQVIGPLTATSAFFDFTSITQNGFRNLRLRLKVRSTHAATNTTIGLQANGDTSSIYSYEVLQDSSTGFTRLSHQADSAAYLGSVPAASALASNAGVLDIAIPNYSDGLNKTFKSEGGFEQSTSSGDQFTFAGSGGWRNTTAISSLRVLLGNGSFDVGSYACLYGEMDSASILLVPASNLLFETVLTSAQASIDTGAINQSYRDLQIAIDARGDTAATSSRVTLRFNGDTGTNYDWNDQISFIVGQIAVSAIQLPRMVAATAPASTSSAVYIDIPDYTNTTYHKTAAGRGTLKLANATNNLGAELTAGFWRNTAAITSIQLAPLAGNFAAGTKISVYGLPLSSGGSSTGTGTRLRISANQSISDATDTLVSWDTEDSDADNQHFTSAANLTGTVAKAAASAVLTGTGTAFTTELVTGQVISVPGTAAEKRVVIKITSNTSLTVNTAYVNTASGQTAARLNTPIVFRQPGQYTLSAGSYWASNATGFRKLAFVLNDTTVIGQNDETSIGATAMGVPLTVQRAFQQWDFVEVQVRQNSGGALNLTADERTFFASSSRPTVIVAVPYACIKDSKAQNTAGGTFTSGADQTRDLQTIDADAAGIVSVVGNQFAIPGGTYEYKIKAPGYQCGAHQAFLYNATDSVEVKRGTSESSGATAATTTWSIVDGRMTTSGSKAFEVRHRCTTTSTTNGFGLPANFGAEVYTVVELRKVG